jgi:hypothetical protein
MLITPNASRQTRSHGQSAVVSHSMAQKRPMAEWRMHRSVPGATSGQSLLVVHGAAQILPVPGSPVMLQHTLPSRQSPSPTQAAPQAELSAHSPWHWPSVSSHVP